MPIPRRRWSYSLRTMFVLLTLLACWLGYQMHWIRQRKDVVAKWQVIREDPMGVSAPPEAPGMLRLFGEQGYSHVTLWFPARRNSDLSESERAEIKRVGIVFPEAGVSWAYTMHGNGK